MELRSSLVKTFQRFSIPRSKSSIGSFSNSMTEKFDDSSSKRRHPPLSYNQHIRSIPASDLRPTSMNEPIDDSIAKNYKVEVLKNQSRVTRDLTFDNRTEIENQNPQMTDREPSASSSRTSFKSFFTKKLHPTSYSSNVESNSTDQKKQKKRRTSFRNFSQILKRSHSAHGDLTNNVVIQVDEKPIEEHEIVVDQRFDSSPKSLSSTPLKTISEEDNVLQQRRELLTKNDEQMTINASNSPSVSARSSTSYKFSNSQNTSQVRSEEINQNFSNSNHHDVQKSARGTVNDQHQGQKHFLSNSMSLHSNVNQLVNNSDKKINFERVSLHATNSLNPNDVENNHTVVVKLRERNSKKKKIARDLKPRISLPPELKKTHLQHPELSRDTRDDNSLKPLARTSTYHMNSRSVQALDRSLNQSIPSLNALSNGHLSRQEQRRSMLDLGWGKLESYTKLEKLGEGTYATVYKGTSNLRSGFVALKEIRLEQEEGAPCTALREVSLLKGLKHSNIVCLYDIIFDRTTLTLVFEYVEKDLKRYMDDCGNILSMKNVRLFLFQLLRGLEFCHSKKILHRDLKPQNLLINERGELKLADFGLARIKSFPTKTYSNEVVTLWYRPPDVLLGSTEYSTPIDIWAVGCIFYEMVQGRPLFAGSKVEEELILIFKTLGTPNETTMPGVTTKSEFQSLKLPQFSGEVFPRSLTHLDATGIDLLMQFLRYNPPSRISAFDAMRHKFFSFYPTEIHQLKPEQSVLVLAELALNKDPGLRFSASAVVKNVISKRSTVHL